MKTRVLAPALAVLALATATTAQAQAQTCVEAADLSDTVLYAMPIAYDAVSTTCAKQLKRDGFMARSGDTFIEKFRARQNTAPIYGTFQTRRLICCRISKSHRQRPCTKCPRWHGLNSSPPPRRPPPSHQTNSQ